MFPEDAFENYEELNPSYAEIDYDIDQEACLVDLDIGWYELDE